MTINKRVQFKFFVALVLIVFTGIFIVQTNNTFAQNPDEDGDGHRAPEFGGDDCDDSDVSRFPGNVEEADPYHDEDCDPFTIGFLDEDGDGFVPDWVCNSVGGYHKCGLDCDDKNNKIHPDAMDICNLRDDDCDGNLDEDQLCSALGDWIENYEEILAERKAAAERERAEREAKQRMGEMVEKTNPTREQTGPPISGIIRETPYLPDISSKNETGGSVCASAIQGKIAWDYAGNKRWGSKNVEKLCKGAENSTTPADCFETVMHKGVKKADGSTKWRWEDALSLCRGSPNSKETIDCFKGQITSGANQDEAINLCSR